MIHHVRRLTTETADRLDVCCFWPFLAAVDRRCIVSLHILMVHLLEVIVLLVRVHVLLLDWWVHQLRVVVVLNWRQTISMIKIEHLILEHLSLFLQLLRVLEFCQQRFLVLQLQSSSVLALREVLSTLS